MRDKESQTNNESQDLLKPAVIYTRVSDKSQEDEGDGLRSQEAVCREYALKYGYDVIATFAEPISG